MMKIAFFAILGALLCGSGVCRGEASDIDRLLGGDDEDVRQRAYLFSPYS
jgi:hypothetical protein